MQTPSAKSLKLYVEIAKTIREQIERGEYRPGDRLPPLAELAKQHDCSRATVREALSTLRGQGLIEFRHGDGTYVRTAFVDLWMEPLDAALLLSVGQVGQLVELQTAMLAAAATRLSEAGQEPDGGLSQSLFQLECAVPNTEEAITAELSFYIRMAECAGNTLLENVIRVMQESFRSCLRLISSDDSIGLETCRATFDAITRRRGDVAREVLYTYGKAIIRKLEMERVGTLHPVEPPGVPPKATSKKSDQN